MFYTIVVHGFAPQEDGDYAAIDQIDELLQSRGHYVDQVAMTVGNQVRKTITNAWQADDRPLLTDKGAAYAVAAIDHDLHRFEGKGGRLPDPAHFPAD